MRAERYVNGVLQALHCARCDRWLPPDSFSRNSAMLRGRSSWCRECAVERTREWRAANREAVNAATRKRHAATRNTGTAS